MRGAPFIDGLDNEFDRIIPAHAGSTPRVTRARTASGDHPRACGEHANGIWHRKRVQGSSPRMRGARLSHEKSPLGSRIIPAHAGSTVCHVPLQSTVWDHPRACGEHATGAIAAVDNAGSSPRMRGAPLARVEARHEKGIIPAHAGSTPGPERPWLPFRDHPRACGEHDDLTVPSVYVEGSSPRMRGAPRDAADAEAHLGIIPAHAGSTVSTLCLWPRFRDHPRACGEHPRLVLVPCGGEGSSPRMRGARKYRSTNGWSSRIIPAHAGSTPRLVLVPCGGEGSSPRMRGARVRDRRVRELQGIIPAHAGSTMAALRCGRTSRDHPRACGEHLPRDSDGSTIRGIIPAHAGSTGESTARGSCVRDHPRACGEHNSSFISPP